MKSALAAVCLHHGPTGRLQAGKHDIMTSTSQLQITKDSEQQESDSKSDSKSYDRHCITGAYLKAPAIVSVLVQESTQTVHEILLR